MWDLQIIVSHDFREYGSFQSILLTMRNIFARYRICILRRLYYFPTTMSSDSFEIYQLILERNALETAPFSGLIAFNTAIQKHSDSLERACELAKREIIHLRFENHDFRLGIKNCSSCNNDSTWTTQRLASQAALRNETKLREKIEQLEEESANKDLLLTRKQDESQILSDKVLDLHRNLREKQDDFLQTKEDHFLAMKSVERLTSKLDDLTTNNHLADQQGEALKNNLRSLQTDNETLTKDNKDLESQLLAEKRKSIDEAKRLNEIVDGLKSHIDMLRSVKHVNEQGVGNSAQVNGGIISMRINQPSNAINLNELQVGNVEIPSSASLAIQAHTGEGTCLVFDRAGSSLIATSSTDSTIKIWDSTNGSLRTVFRGSYGNSMTSCDIVGNLVVGTGSDKTCRVWNISAERLVHQLVGHQNKVTCVRLCIDKKSVITGSTDCTLKVWDISRSTYRQTLSLPSSSAPNCVDVRMDGVNAVSGHVDGGLRFWDVRTGKRTFNLKQLHDGGVSSVQYDPNNIFSVLTTGFDATIKLMDVRNGVAVQVFEHNDISLRHRWVMASFSQGGRYAASGSTMTEQLFVWDSVDGSLRKHLSAGNDSGVIALDWSRQRDIPNKLATLDRKGKLIIWS